MYNITVHVLCEILILEHYITILRHLDVHIEIVCYFVLIKTA